MAPPSNGSLPVAPAHGLARYAASLRLGACCLFAAVVAAFAAPQRGAAQWDACLLDRTRGLAVCPADAVANLPDWIARHAGGAALAAATPVAGRALAGTQVAVLFGGDTIDVHASPFPLLRVDLGGAGSGAIPDEPKRPGRLSVAMPSGDRHETWIGIERSGFSAQWYDKTNYLVEAWVDTIAREGNDIQLAPGLRLDDDWVLNGLQDEPHRLRSRFAQQLWAETGRLPGDDLDPRARVGPRSAYVELAIDGDYRGLYLASERYDRKLLRLTRTDADGTRRGELFKAGFWSDATTFRGAPPYDNALPDYHRWEQKYPSAGDGVDYAGLHALVAYVARAATLSDSLAARLWLPNLVDHWLFVNVLLARDNTGTNTYAARYDRDRPWLLLPWDLDATLGSDWSGAFVPDSVGVYGNGLYDRLQAEDATRFRACAKRRLSQLLAGPWSSSRIAGRWASLAVELRAGGAYERERLRWGDDASMPRLDETSDPALEVFGQRARRLTDYLASAPPATAATCEEASVSAVAAAPAPEDCLRRVGPRSWQLTPSGARDTHIRLRDAAGRVVATGRDALQAPPSLPAGVYVAEAGCGSRQAVVLAE